MAPAAKKSGRKKSGKKKAASSTYCTTPDDLAPFGFCLRDLVRTPLGLVGTVLGVKYPNPSTKDNGTLWLRYASGSEHPFEPLMGPASLGPHASLGYDVCSKSDHIWRDVHELREMHSKSISSSSRLRMEALNLTSTGGKAASVAVLSSMSKLPPRPNTAL